MAKHPHRLLLIDRKTWKCTLPGCSFFVHLGLAHVLIGKTAICWKCNDQFTVDDVALTDEMPKCMDCRITGNDGKMTLRQMSDIIEKKMALARAGVKETSELTPMQRNTMKNLGILPDVPDEVEVIEPTEDDDE